MRPMTMQQTDRIQELERSVKERDLEIEDLSSQLKERDELLKDNQNLIIGLQSLLRDITPMEIVRDFESLTGSIDNWVLNSLLNVDYKPAESREILYNILQDPESAEPLCASLKQRADLVRASKYSETSHDILVALVWQYLDDEIFSGPFYDAGNNIVDHIAALSRYMATAAEPKRPMIKVREWEIEAYNALIISPEFPPQRARIRTSLSMKLAKTLQVLCPGSKLEDISQSIETKVMDAAMKFKEKLATVRDIYELRLLTYDSGEEWDRYEFRRNLQRADSDDILNNRVTLDVDKHFHRMEHGEDVGAKLQPVCTIFPMLLRQTEEGTDREKHGEIQCHVKQKQLYVFCSNSEKRKLLRETPQGFINAILELHP